MSGVMTTEARWSKGGDDVPFPVIHEQDHETLKKTLLRAETVSERRTVTLFAAMKT